MHPVHQSFRAMQAQRSSHLPPEFPGGSTTLHHHCRFIRVGAVIAWAAAAVAALRCGPATKLQRVHFKCKLRNAGFVTNCRYRATLAATPSSRIHLLDTRAKECTDT